MIMTMISYIFSFTYIIPYNIYCSLKLSYYVYKMICYVYII